MRRALIAVRVCVRACERACVIACVHGGNRASVNQPQHRIRSPRGCIHGNRLINSIGLRWACYTIDATVNTLVLQSLAFVSLVTNQYPCQVTDFVSSVLGRACMLCGRRSDRCAGPSDTRYHVTDSGDDVQAYLARKRVQCAQRAQSP